MDNSLCFTTLGYPQQHPTMKATLSTHNRHTMPVLLLLLLSLTASAQVTLTPMQVRTVHAIIDSEARLREQAALDSADLADYAIALRHCETLRVKAEADAADLRLLAGVHSNRADKMNAALVSQARKTRARSVVAWVAVAVAVVEGVVIVIVTR